MSTFAPVYRTPKSQQSFLTREQKRERKRKRDEDDGEEDSDAVDEQSPDSEDDDAPRMLHPVNRTDPFYVAGHPREKPLPGGNFPHAAIKENKELELPAEEELARLNPRLYVPKFTTGDHRGSLRRRHLDNLTAILHKCMLNGDWKRASRAWGLLLRTEVAGRGIDIRQNGRWMIGAELLLRRNQTIEQQQARSRPSSSSDDSEVLHDEGETTFAVRIIAEESFKLAREYYERLILQYPHLPQTHQTATSALSIYPALFNVWIYEVQSRSHHARQRVAVQADSSGSDMNSSPGGSVESNNSEQRRSVRQARRQELEEALPIAQRLDEVMLNPPYDNNAELLHMRGMVGLWLSDLHKAVSGSNESSSGTSDENDDEMPVDRHARVRHQRLAQYERNKAKKVFEKMKAAGMEVSKDVLTFF